MTKRELVKNGVLSETASNKSLNDLTTEELGKLFPIIIQDYSEHWIDLYDAEKQIITNSFAQSEIVSIDHIGSTAVPGLKAKPTIDILFQVSEQIDTQKLVDIFTSLGYQLTEQPDNPQPHMTFVKGYAIHGFSGQTYHVHIRFKGDWDEIRFRDYLINNPNAANDYEVLKLKLAVKYKNDREAYTNSKNDFINKINKLTQKQSTNS